jgi:ribosomal protein S18 acetylase RimI-like enzyme
MFTAQLAPSDLGDAALAAGLRLARNEGVRLLVWHTTGDRHVSDELLEEFNGTLVDRKATYSRSLAFEPQREQKTKTKEFPVVSYEQRTASTELIALAVSAGEYSRFRVDTHIPAERFEAMYRRWIERSVAQELADAVLVASLREPNGTSKERLVGMVTVSQSGDVASIGLIAVAPTMRGRGVGAALMQASHRWMREREAQEARVVTQLANVAACRLYERSGYQQCRLQNYYHFWLQ